VLQLGDEIGGRGVEPAAPHRKEVLTSPARLPVTGRGRRGAPLADARSSGAQAAVGAGGLVVKRRGVRYIPAMPHQSAEPPVPPLRGVRVRPAKIDDLRSIIALDEENTGLPKGAYWRDRFEWYAGRQPDRFFLVAERDGTTLGFIVGEIRAWEFGSPPSGWIFAIGVSPSERLQGLGTLLFDEICARFREAGVQHARTMLGKDAHLVMSFFRSQGMMGGPFIQLEKRLEP
jgi:ribosomal protein S18 acetylase RimI-like enzyme